MTSPPPHTGGGLRSAGTDRERGCPAVAGFFVDEQPPHETLTTRKWKCAEIDPEGNPQFASWCNTRGSSGFELAVEADRFVADLDWSAVFVGEIETPMMFDVGLVPRHGDSHGDRHLLRSRADHTESAAENEEFPVVDLHGVGHENDGAERRRVELEVGLIHDVDPSGMLRLTGSCR